MHSLWDRVYAIVIERPIAMFVMLWCLASGIFGLVGGLDDLDTPNEIGLSVWISLYLLIASIALIVSTFADDKHVRIRHFGQVWGWLFISSASVALVFAYLATLGATDSEPYEHAYWMTTWGTLAVFAFIRSMNALYHKQENHV